MAAKVVGASNEELSQEKTEAGSRRDKVGCKPVEISMEYARAGLGNLLYLKNDGEPLVSLRQRNDRVKFEFSMNTSIAATSIADIIL